MADLFTRAMARERGFTGDQIRHRIRSGREPVARRDQCRRRGLPATVPARTVLDCLRSLPLPEAESLLDRALQRRWITWDDLVRRVGQEVGRHGVERLVTLLRRAGSGARSAAERLLVTGLRQAKVTGWIANLPVFDEDGLIGEVDVGFDGIRLAVEIDGRAWHSSKERFQEDRTRQNRLTQAGWTVLRYTWADLTSRPEEVVAEIAGLARRLRFRR